MNSQHPIVDTLEHRRFTEFCDACRTYQYIGLCYGTPGVGKTLSARTYSQWDEAQATMPWREEPREGPALATVFYTPAVVNSPGRISHDIRRARHTLTRLARRPVQLVSRPKLVVQKAPI